MASTITVGIAGLGRSGWNIHARNFQEQMDHFRVTAAADQIVAYREEAGQIFGASVYPDYRDMLAAGGFSVFVNALPTPLHVPATLEALEAGFHVVCEKPMAPNLASFDRMVHTAEARHLRLLPFQNNRLQPFFDQILKVIESGVLGRIVHIRSIWGGFSRRWDWQTRQENLGGSLFNTGPHAIDQALMLFGESCDPSVFCRLDCSHTLGGDADDFCSLTLFDRQRRAPTIDILLAAQLRYPPTHMYAISGTTGSLTANAQEVLWSWFDAEQAPAQPFWPGWAENRKYPRETLNWQEASWKLETDRLKDAVGYTLPSLPSGAQRFYLNAHAVLREQAEPLITLRQVRRQIAVIEECHRQNPLPRSPLPVQPGLSR